MGALAVPLGTLVAALGILFVAVSTLVVARFEFVDLHAFEGGALPEHGLAQGHPGQGKQNPEVDKVILGQGIQLSQADCYGN